MEKIKVPVTIKTEKKESLKMSISMKVALALTGGSFAWLLGLVLGKLIIETVFVESLVLLLIWGVILFEALLFAIMFYISRIT